MLIFGIRLVKYLELVLSIYLLVIGLLFIIDPHFLSSPVYRAWQSAGAFAWGSGLLFVGLAHVGALWLNGRNRQMSRMVRAIASTLHLAIAIQFAFFFLSGGAPWGAVTMSLMIAILMPIVGSAIDDAKRVWGQSNGFR